MRAYSNETGARVFIFRLPNVFGKWCRPNYNSAVATFCHNIANGLPIQVNDPSVVMSLVYIDDVIDAFMLACEQLADGSQQAAMEEYGVSCGAPLPDREDLLQRLQQEFATSPHAAQHTAGLGAMERQAA